jgi:quinol-cytochrome oxidoreductase complex cytochrome b subunit
MIHSVLASFLIPDLHIHLFRSFFIEKYREIQEQKSIFWEAIVWVIERKTSYELMSNTEWLPR